jgi:hypothetical protein
MQNSTKLDRIEEISLDRFEFRRQDENRASPPVHLPMKVERESRLEGTGARALRGFGDK